MGDTSILDAARRDPHNAAMSDYRIEKIRRQLSVVLTDGTWLEGEVFLRPVSRYRSQPEQPMDLLNDAEPFFALIRSGETLLVAKSSVARAETSYQPDDELEISPLGVTVEVSMTDGSVCTGSIFLDTRTDRPRLLDFLNSYRERFLPVVDARKVFLVNTQIIAHLREVA
jgi:hypothetical protein